MNVYFCVAIIDSYVFYVYPSSSKAHGAQIEARRAPIKKKGTQAQEGRI